MSQGFLAETEETGDNSRDDFCCNNNNNNINNNQMRTTRKTLNKTKTKDVLHTLYILKLNH